MRFLIAFITLFLFQNGFSQEKFTVYFETGKYEVTSKEKLKLENWMKSNATSKIVAIEGYTDDVGSSDSNDTLAKKRVDFIFKCVAKKIQIRDDFKSRSFGENFNQSENKAENRKATSYYLLEKDIAREDEILGIKELVQFIPDSLSLKDKIKLAKVGTKIILKEINFYQNTFAIMPESNSALYDLLTELGNNPELKIQIQGHICCVEEDRSKLSLERAKQVRRFLVYKGIQQYRITVTGFGVTRPLYPIPEQNEEQALANRRVEIEIISK